MLPLSVVVVIAVFGLQPQGTARIGRLFGPVMTLWFVTIGVLGLAGVARHPAVLAALDPRYGLDYLFGHGLTGFLVLGGVFLCATGAEALYADMGRFGPQPIRITWYGLVLPTLLLNYAGQTAVVVDGEAAAGANPFFVLCPAILQLPLVALATAATIIASQAIISGTFSMTRQAIQLGLCPRLRITQTSSEGYGQIYVGFVNWTLMALTLGLAVSFRSSDNLAAAFGIAVALTMLLTSLLMFVDMREVWGWSLLVSVLVAGVFVIVDFTHVPRVLERCSTQDLHFNMMDTSFFVSRVKIVAERKSRLGGIRCKMFEAMHRNALAATEFFRIPPNRVIELGGQVEI